MADELRPPPRREQRAPMRDDMLPEMRIEEDTLAAAERRAKEIMEHAGGQFSEAPDKFNVPADKVPDGWTYEWKMRTVLNQENPAYQIQLANTGWTAVPLSRHPEMMPHGYSGNTIEMDGVMLMERPKSITDMVKTQDRRRAADQVRFKEEQLGAAPAGQFDRANKGSALASVKKSYAPIPVPSE